MIHDVGIAMTSKCIQMNVLNTEMEIRECIVMGEIRKVDNGFDELSVIMQL